MQLNNMSDGVYQFQSENENKEHDLSFRTNTPISSGTIKVEARKPGSDVFEAIPGGELIDFGSMKTVQFYGSVAEYKVTLAGASAGKVLFITDV